MVTERVSAVPFTQGERAGIDLREVGEDVPVRIREGGVVVVDGQPRRSRPGRAHRNRTSRNDEAHHEQWIRSCGLGSWMPMVLFGVILEAAFQAPDLLF